MIRRNFPSNDFEADEYGGFMRDEMVFCRLFDCKNSYSETLGEINKFLVKNGFDIVDYEEFDEELGYENQYLSISKHGYLEKLILFIKNPNPFEMTKVIERLKAFRDERDWDQFHNSKDLALAISIEASELLELFLWKKEEDFDQEKLKDELADVMSFCYLLAEKHGMNIPEIILEKIEKNALKYPVEKAKGTSRKYNEL